MITTSIGSGWESFPAIHKCYQSCLLSWIKHHLASTAVRPLSMMYLDIHSLIGGGGSIFGSKDSKVTSYLLNWFFKAPFCVGYGRLANAWCTLTLTRFWKVVGKGKLCSNVSKVPSELLTRLFKAPFCVRYGGVPTAWFTQTFIPCYPIMTTLLALRRSNRAESIREICNTISYLFSSYEYFRWKGQALISKDTECNFKNNFSMWIFQQHPWDDT